MTPTDTATLVEQLDVLTDRLVVAARGAGDHAGLRDAGSLLHSVDRLIATPKCRPNCARRWKSATAAAASAPADAQPRYVKTTTSSPSPTADQPN